MPTLTDMYSDATIYDPMQQTAGTTATQTDTQSKTTNLLDKTQQKVALLSDKKSNLLAVADEGKPYKYGQKPDLVNYKTPEEIQYELGVAADHQVLTRPDGSKYTFARNADDTYKRDANGQWIEENYDRKNSYGSLDTRNAYIDDTAEGNRKFGVAVSGLSQDAIDKGITPYQARYMDKTHYNPYAGTRQYKENGKIAYNPDGTVKLGYDGTPGAKGVTPANGSLMDIELPYNLATQLEYDIHTNAGQLASRAAGQGKVEQNIKDQFGAGYTEYTTPDAPLWNNKYDINSAKIDPETVLPREVKLVNGTNQQTGMKAKVQTPEQQDAYKQLMALGTKDPDGRLGETVDLTQASTVKYWGDMAAAARSGSRALAGTLGVSKENIDKYLPENAKLLGTDLTVEEARKDQEKVDKSVGYSTRDAWNEEKKAYSANITNKEYGSAAWNVATNLDRYLAESAPEMAVLMTPYAGIPSVVATRLNNQMDEFEKTNGRKMTTEEAFATAASIVPSLIAEKFLVKSGVGEALTTGKSVGGKVAGVGMSTAGEGLQEGYEATQEQWATGKAEDRTSLDKLGEYASSDETIGGVIAGGVMGGALRTAGETPEVVAGMLPSAGTAVNVIKKSIELATETDEQKAVRENMKYTAPLKAEAEAGLATGATDDVVSKVEAIHGKLTEDLDESAPKAFTYGRVIRDALTKAAKNEDTDAIKNIYKTIAELDAREDVDFKAKDVIDERTYEATKQFKDLINSNESTESKLNAMKLGKQVAAEADATVKTAGAQMDANILEKVKSMKASLEQDIKDMKDVMGSDQFDENSKGPKELVDLIDMYISGKGLDTVNAEMSKLGYIELDPSGGLRADPNRPGIQTYARELESALLNPKANKNLLDEKVTKAGGTTLTGLERFANSRLEKLNKDKAYQTSKLLGQLINENAQMLEAIQKLQNTASGLKGIKANTKSAYETVLDNAYNATKTANEQMVRRQEILSKLGKSANGQYAYQIDKAGNETIQLVNGKDRQEVAKVTAEGTVEWIDDKFANREIKTTAKAVPDEIIYPEEYHAKAKFNEDIPIYEEDSPETKAILKEFEEAENNGASIEVIKELTDRLLASQFNNKESVVIEPTMESRPDEVINKEDYKAQAKFTEPVKVTETKPADPKDPLRAVREKIAKLDETLSAELAKVKDMDVKQHIKDYYAKKLDEINADKTKLNSLFDRIEKAVDARLDRLEGISTKNPLAGLIAYADKLIKSMLNKLDELRNKLRLNKNQFDATKAELNDLLGMINTIEQDYLDSKGIKPEVVKTSIGKVTKYTDTVYGKPMIETKDKRVEAVQKKTSKGLQTPETALNQAMAELVDESIAEYKAQGDSLSAKIMVRNLQNFHISSAVHRMITQGQDSIFGKLGADLFSNPKKLLEALPKSFKEFFVTDEQDGKDLIENFKTMNKFINGVELGPIYMNGEKITGNIDKQGLVQKLTDKYVPINRPIEAGDKLQNVKDRTTLTVKADKSNLPTNLKDYEVKDIYETSRPVDILELIGTVKEGSTYRKIHSTKIVDDKEVKITESLNPKDKVKDKNGKVWTIQQFKGKEIKLIDPTNDNIKATKSINELESVQNKVLEIDEQTKTILKFYSAKMIIDTQAMVGNILSMDDAELIKYYGLTDAEERQTVRENAANGLVSSASVRKSIGAEVYQALGIKLDRNTPEFTQESFESALGVLVQAIAVDNGTMSMEQEKFKNKYQNLISVNKAMIESDELLGIDGNNALIKAMNKLQYLNENRNRPLPSFKKMAPVENGKRFVMNTKMAIDSETNAKMNKTEEIAYTISDRLDKYLEMPEEDVLKMMGYKDVENSGLHISEQSAQQARNDKLVREWNILKTFAKAAKGKKFYIPWGQTVSGRYTMLSDLQYQESKLHREFVVADNKEETVDVNNADNVQMMKASILQGLDMDPDKLSPETANAKFDETFKVTDKGLEVIKDGPIKEAYEAVRDGKFNIEAMAEVFDDSEGHHGLSSIELLVEWDKAIKGKGKFKTASSVEIDAITSGMILTLLQIGTDKAIQMAEKGGIYTADRMPALKEYVKHWLGDVTFTPGALIEAGKKHAAAIEAGANATKEQIGMLKGQSKDLLSDDVFKDLYSTIGVGMIEEVEAYKTTLMKKDVKTDSEMMQLAMLEQIGELNLKNIRSIAKSPVMVYIYGASIGSIKNKLTHSLGVDTLIKAIKKASKMQPKVEEMAKLQKELDEKEKRTEEEFRQLKAANEFMLDWNNTTKFINGFIPDDRKAYKNMYGMKVDTTDMSEADKLLHLEVDEKSIEDIGKVIDATFGTAIEKAFKNKLGFVDDNRDAVKSVEILTFEAYKIKLNEAVKTKLTEKYGSEGAKKGSMALSKDDLVDINNRLIDEGYGHTIVWNQGNRVRNQSLQKTADKGGIHSSRVRVGDTTVGGQIKESKPIVNTGAASTIPIHAIDGEMIMETLNRELKGELAGKYTGGNVYDAVVLGLNKALLTDTADYYNTGMIETGFSRSIMADQLDKLEKMLSGLVKDGLINKFTDAIGLRPKGDGAFDYAKEANRLGLSVSKMLERIELAEQLNNERLVNSTKAYGSGHLYQMGSGVVDVKSADETRAKEFPGISRIKAMLKKVIERDRAKTAEEFKGKIADGVDYVLDLNDFIEVKNGTDSKGNLAQFRLDGKQVQLDNNMLKTLTNKDTVQILGDKELVIAKLEGKKYKGSAKKRLNKLLSELGKTDANILTESKDSPKGKYSTLTKEKIPTELNKLVDGIKDENLKSAIGKWVNDKLKTMENC